MEYTILGSCTKLLYPQGTPEFFEGENLIDPRNGSLMEMDAYSLLLLFMLKEDRANITKVVSGLLKNLNKESNFWEHSVWTENEIHLRFTSSALRTLVIAYKNKFFDDLELLLQLFNTHLSYVDRQDGMVWFLHDSLELEKEHLGRNIKLKKWRNDISNMFVLNTHLDTINTILHLQNEKIFEEGRFNEHLSQGIRYLEESLEHASNSPEWFHSMDHSVREIYFKVHHKRNVLAKLLKKLISIGYFSILRLRLKNSFPTYFFKDGYIERDLCLTGKSFEYHVVNLWDMAKFCLLSKNKKEGSIASLRTLFIEKIVSGISYIENSNYKLFLQHELNDAKNGYIELCEVIIVLLQLGIREKQFFSLYVNIRKKLPPSLSLKFQDPLINPSFDSYTLKYQDDEGIDVVKISAMEYFIANLKTNSELIEFENSKVSIGQSRALIHIIEP